MTQQEHKDKVNREIDEINIACESAGRIETCVISGLYGKGAGKEVQEMRNRLYTVANAAKAIHQLHAIRIYDLEKQLGIRTDDN